eukprot:136789-Prymnesium_polylepis.2
MSRSTSRTSALGTLSRSSRRPTGLRRCPHGRGSSRFASDMETSSAHRAQVASTPSPGQASPRLRS